MHFLYFMNFLWERAHRRSLRKLWWIMGNLKREDLFFFINELFFHFFCLLKTIFLFQFFSLRWRYKVSREVFSLILESFIIRKEICIQTQKRENNSMERKIPQKSSHWTIIRSKFLYGKLIAFNYRRHNLKLLF